MAIEVMNLDPELVSLLGRKLEKGEAVTDKDLRLLHAGNPKVLLALLEEGSQMALEAFQLSREQVERVRRRFTYF